MKRFALAATCAALGVVALAIPAGAPASYPASAQRLLVTGESSFLPQVRLLDETGKVRATLNIFPGMNGGIAVSRRGTRFAYVQTLGFELPPEVPEKFRKRFARLPRSTLQLGAFLTDVRSGGTFFVSTSFPATAAAPGRPAWSPGGRRIVFAQARRGNVHLVSSAIGSRSPPQQLTRSPGRDLNPRWSPDGRSIVFERHVAGEADLYSIAPDGSDLRRLTYWHGRELSPDFSPDGGSLVFSSDVTGRFQLYVMPVGGSFPTRLTVGFGDDRRPVWSPDGRWIAYSSDRDGDDDVYLVSPDGRRERKLTHNASQDLVQEWQPLRDSRPPLVRALPSSSPRGRTAELRYRLSDESARVLVSADVLFEGETFVSSRSVRPQVVRTRPRRMHVLRLPADRLDPFEDEGDSGVEPPSRIRFCLVAVDPWGNGSTSCSTFRFR